MTISYHSSRKLLNKSEIADWQSDVFILIPLESLSSCVDLPFGSLSSYDQENPPVGKLVSAQ